MDCSVRRLLLYLWIWLKLCFWNVVGAAKKLGPRRKEVPQQQLLTPVKTKRISDSAIFDGNEASAVTTTPQSKSSAKAARHRRSFPIQESRNRMAGAGSRRSLSTCEDAIGDDTVAKLKECHSRAFKFITAALEIDESVSGTVFQCT